MTINAIDLFAGCGGLTEGLEQAGITVKYAVELDPRISKIYEGNHHKTIMINSDIRRISDDDFRRMGHVDIVAGCPPCQGFTQMNRNNKRRAYSDKRNILIEEYLRAVKIIKPNFIMMENVPQIIYYDRFNSMLEELKEIGYSIDFKEINVKDFGIPQSRRRLVLIGALSHDVDFPFRMNTPVKTVRDAIESLPKPTDSSDPIHRIHSNHTPYIQHIIELIPKNGGNRKNLPKNIGLSAIKKQILVILMSTVGCFGIDLLRLSLGDACRLQKDDFYIRHKIEASVLERLLFCSRFQLTIISMINALKPYLLR
ncbi:C-5 cytosine-specific DNA methylase [Lacticaseibacillus paracasei]|nr:C-5 cytosine-specific DNA methylase [Lacticaseibacillus paracasei]